MEPEQERYRKSAALANEHPTEDGYYWATTVQRNRTRRRPWMGQVGGYRTIVRLYRHHQPWAIFRVQVLGSEHIHELDDFTDYEGPIGDGHFV